MKYFLVLLIFTHAILAEDLIIEENEANTDVDSAGFMMMPMGGCGNTCMCRQRCTMIWWMPCNCGPCNGCGCCDSSTTQTNPTEVTTTTETTTPTTTTTTTVTDSTTTTNNCGGNCCSGCSCRRPCTIWWMCPRPCAPSCCNGGSSCCNSNPTPPPPPPECCSCPICVPWTPCQPCRCMNNCCPGSNCCSGSGCSTTTTVPSIINDINLDDRWLDNGVPEWDIRIPDRKDPWDDYPPRFPRDPISNSDRFRDRRDPVYVPPTSDMIKLEEWEIRDILERRDRRDQRY